MGTIKKSNETKRDRFIRVVERRVNKILDGLDALGMCSNKKNYEYSEADVMKIFKEIEVKTKNIKSSFQSAISKKKEFKLTRR